MDGGIVLGILAVLALSVSSALMLRLLLQSPTAINWFADEALPGLRRRLHRSVEQPTGRPIEEIASSIRRLGAAFYGGPPGRSWVKSEAFRRAYEQALDEGCRALEIDTDLLDLEPGTDHDAERLRVEHLLDRRRPGPAPRRLAESARTRLAEPVELGASGVADTALEPAHRSSRCGDRMPPTST